jgi:DNA-binding transcriptional MerR regulator
MTDFNLTPAGGVVSSRAGAEIRAGAGAIQLLALRYCQEAVELVARLMREGMRDDGVRLAAIREILDRGVGKPVAAVDLSVNVDKHLADMTEEELEALRARYVAMTTASPMLIDQVLKEPEESELDQSTLFGEAV